MSSSLSPPVRWLYRVLGIGCLTLLAAYPSKEAERVRAAYEKGTLETFRSGLNK